MSACDFKNLDPNDISEHPLLANISILSTEKYEVLKQSIAESGIQIPVTCIHGKDDQYVLIGGRHRLKAAKELHLARIPAVIQADGEDILKFILDTAITGRQISKSGIALTLFECNPAMIENRKARQRLGKSKKRDLVTNSQGSPVNKDGHIVETESEASFTELAGKYHVPREYLSRLATIREQCRPWPGDRDFEWKLVKRWILEDEMGITRLLPALEGYQLTHCVGKDKTQIKASGKLPPTVSVGIERSFSYLHNQFSKWGTMHPKERSTLTKMWFEMVLPNLPEDLRHGQPK